MSSREHKRASRAVQEHFGCSYSTALHYVRQHWEEIIRHHKSKDNLGNVRIFDSIRASSIEVCGLRGLEKEDAP